MENILNDDQQVTGRIKKLFQRKGLVSNGPIHVGDDDLKMP